MTVFGGCGSVAEFLSGLHEVLVSIPNMQVCAHIDTHIELSFFSFSFLPSFLLPSFFLPLSLFLPSFLHFFICLFLPSFLCMQMFTMVCRSWRRIYTTQFHHVASSVKLRSSGWAASTFNS